MRLKRCQAAVLPSQRPSCTPHWDQMRQVFRQIRLETVMIQNTESQ